MELKHIKSHKWMERAERVIPGGVNSPVRSFGAVDGVPPFIDSAEEACIYDVDGNRYIDYVCGWGSLVLGHCDDTVLTALEKALSGGTTFGACTHREVILAELICNALPGMDKVRLVNSGTEAAMSAIRLARAYTGRNRVVKFAGCYHGHVDSLLVAAGSGAATLGVPDSAGIPESFAETTIVCPYNDLESVNNVFAQFGDEIAAIIVEPVAGNMGVVPPKEGFLEGLRKITEHYRSLLIFDEVMTGFRIDYHGAQGHYKIRPDLTILGKIIGGGLPVGAFGGKADIMDMMAPLGNVYQAGTLSGNPLATAAGIATLNQLRDGSLYGQMDERGKELAEGLASAAREYGVPATVNRVGSMISIFFTEGPVTNYEGAKKADKEAFKNFHQGMLKEGIYLPPSPFESWFISSAHSEEEIGETIDAAIVVMEKKLSSSGANA